MPTIEYKLEGDTSSFKAGMAGAVGALEGVAAAALAAGAATKALLDDAFGKIDTIGTFAGATGLSIETINGLRAAARATNKDLQELVPRELASKMLTAQDRFRQFGIEVLDTNGHMRSSDEVFRDVIQLLDETAEGSERAAIANELMGEAGRNLLSAFEGTDGLDHFINQANRWGLDVGPEAVEQANAWWKATGNLELALEDAAQRLVDRLAPAATSFIDSFTIGFVFLSEVADQVFDAMWSRLQDVGAAFRALYEGDVPAFVSSLTDVSDEISQVAGSLDAAYDVAFEFWRDNMADGAKESAQATEEATRAVNFLKDAAQPTGDAFWDAFGEAAEAAWEFRDALPTVDLFSDLSDGASDMAEDVRDAYVSAAADIGASWADMFSTLHDLAAEDAANQAAIERDKVADLKRRVRQAEGAEKEQLQVAIAAAEEREAVANAQALKAFKVSQNWARAEAALRTTAAFIGMTAQLAPLMGPVAPIVAAGVTGPMLIAQLAIIDRQEPPVTMHAGGLAPDEIMRGAIRALAGEQLVMLNSRAVRGGAVERVMAENQGRSSSGAGEVRLVLANAGRAVAELVAVEERTPGTAAFRRRAAGEAVAYVNPYTRS